MTREEFQTERTRIISEMLDNPDEYGIYPTTKCFEQLDALFDSLSLPPAEGAEDIRQLLLGWEHYKRDHLRESEALDVEAILLSEYSQIAAQPQPTAEGTGKTCHAKEMEYNHNMCAMQESCEKCEAYKVPTNEGDIAKTETDTGRIVDMPDLSQPTAEGAEEIDDETIAWAAEHQCGTPFSERWIGFVKGAKWHRSLHAQRIAEKMVEEKLREGLIAYGKVIRSWGIAIPSDILECSIDEYLKTRDSHE
jgi:hypothetical protein